MFGHPLGLDLQLNSGFVPGHIYDADREGLTFVAGILFSPDIVFDLV